MSKSEIQKLKTLYVAKFFLENCDDNHSVLAGDIPNFLKGNVISMSTAAAFTERWSTRWSLSPYVPSVSY